MADLKNAGCKILTLGQYLQPAPGFLEVSAYINPEKFEEYRKAAIEMGFRFVESHPLVRSSFHSEKHVKAQ